MSRPILLSFWKRRRKSYSRSSVGKAERSWDRQGGDFLTIRGVMNGLSPGTWVTVRKLRPDGSEATRYPGQVIPCIDRWIAVRAEWRLQRIDLGCLDFEPG